jgi:hypothetical protein
MLPPLAGWAQKVGSPRSGRRLVNASVGASIQIPARQQFSG